MKRKPFWALFTAILLLTTLFPSTALADYTYDGSIDCTSGTVTGGEGWRWDAGSSTLTIEANTTITVPAGSSYGINLPADAKLQLNGLVTIQADGSSGTFTGVQFAGDGEITGGSLTVTGGSSAVSVNGDLTLKGVIIAGTGTGIAFTGSSSELTVHGQCTLDSVSSSGTVALDGNGALFLSKADGISFENASNLAVFTSDSSGNMVLQNNAEIANNEITLSDGKTYIIPSDKTLTIGYGGSLTVPSGSTLQNNGTLNNTNGGTMFVNGNLVNNGAFNCTPNTSAAPTTTINGTVENNGTITNGDDTGSSNTSTITVGGTINNNGNGTIVNKPNGIITGSGVINNSGTINNTGTITGVTVKNITSTGGGGGDSSPSIEAVYNAKGDMWLIGPGLTSSDKLRTTEISSSFLAALAQGNTIIGIWDLSLESGKTSTPGATLYMKIADLKEGQTYTLVHQNGDGTLDYYYATANSQKTLAFSPINSPSPFMLVEGMLVAGEMNIPRTGDAADLLAPLACVIAAAGLIVLRRKARGRA